MDKKGKWIICTAIMVMLGFLPVMANAQSKGAVVIKDESIVFFNIDNNLMEVTLTEMKGSTKVVTPSPNCNKNVSAHGKYPVTPPGRSIVFDFDSTEVPCIVLFDGIPYATNKWHQVISRSGRVSLTCHFKVCDEYEPSGPPECTTDPYCIGCYQDYYGYCCPFDSMMQYDEVEPGMGPGWVCWL